jgi:hypothetical protein
MDGETIEKKGIPKRRKKKGNRLSDKKMEQGFCWLRSPYNTHTVYGLIYISLELLEG